MATKMWTNYCRRRHEKKTILSQDAKAVLWVFITFYILAHIVPLVMFAL